MKICSACFEAKPLTAFYAAKARADGLQSQCKKCANDSYRGSREKKPSHYREVARARHAKNTALIRAWKVERGCTFCPEREAVCLELHHLDPEEKEADPSTYASKSIAAFLKEAEKCIVVCANCHRKVHIGLLTYN